VAGKVVPGTSKGPAKFYGIAVGHRPGVYTEWTDAQIQITNVKGPKYRKFDTREEAEAFVDSGGKIDKVKKVEKTAEQQEDGERERKKAKTATSKTGSKGGYVKVWTDGSARGNGKANAEAGVGVYFGYDDERYVFFDLT
jgi:ribonuclease HI